MPRTARAPQGAKGGGAVRASRRLARFDQRVEISDQGSTNGTYVNDERIETARLRDGDLVKVGRSILKFLSGDEIEAAYHEVLYRLATVDGLTQVFNKRYFNETLEREIEQARRTERPLSLLMIDIDRFRHCNEEHGHPAGDAVLRWLASLLREGTRTQDVRSP